MNATLLAPHVELPPEDRVNLAHLNERMPRYFRRLIALNWEVKETTRTYAASCSAHSRKAAASQIAARLQSARSPT